MFNHSIQKYFSVVSDQKFLECVTQMLSEIFPLLALIVTNHIFTVFENRDSIDNDILSYVVDERHRGRQRSDGGDKTGHIGHNSFAVNDGLGHFFGDLGQFF